jgi:hypothetical protein
MNLKVNKNSDNQDKGFDVIPNQDVEKNSIPGVENEQQSSYVNVNPAKSKRKLFPNKKANIALIITGAVIVVLIIAAEIFIHV